MATIEHPTTAHTVYCHKCIARPDGGLRDDLKRNAATLHGSPEWGGLWHCSEHSNCDFCAHEQGYCDPQCRHAASKGSFGY